MRRNSCGRLVILVGGIRMKKSLQGYLLFFVVLMSALFILGLILQEISYILTAGLSLFFSVFLIRKLIIWGVFAEQKKEHSPDNDMVKHLLDLSEQVSFDAQQLIWLLEANKNQTGDLVKIFKEIALSSEDNMASIEELSASIEEISSSSQFINNKTEDIQQVCQRALENSRKNKDWIRDAGQTLLNVSETVKKSGSSIENLKNISEEINHIVDDIKGITGQINLLSLNAAIEAARSGEAGRGFAVVASEIKKLSQETDEMTSEIQKTTEKITDEVKNTSLVISDGIGKISRVEKISRQLIQSFDDITGQLKNILEYVSELSGFTEEQAEATYQSSTTSESICEKTTNVFQNIQDTLSIIDEQNKNSEKIFEYSQRLNDIGYNLHKISVGQRNNDTLILGVNPFTDPLKIKELYLPIINEVARGLGKKIKTIIVSDYEALTKYIKDRLIDIGWFSPMAYVNAKNELELIPLVSPVINGKASYYGYIIAHKDNSFNNLRDLKGCSFGFVDPLSTSGYIYPRKILLMENIDPEHDFKNIYFLGSHNNVIQAVLEKRIEAGATYNEALERAEKDGLPISNLQILKKTDPIPKDAIAVHPEISKDIIEKIKKEFVCLNEKREIKQILRKTSIDGFIEINDSNYDVIREYQKI